MEVKLLTSATSIHDMEQFAAIAALTCHGNADKEFVPWEVLGRIIKAGHESVLEHITLTYSVKGLSRACLQELARHRHISLSVESTRHTLKKYVNNPEWWHNAIISKDQPDFRRVMMDTRKMLVQTLTKTPDAINDELKYLLPEMWPTNLILTSNIRELRHIIRLRTSPAALKEFQFLALELYNVVPDGYRYLLEDCVYHETPHD